MSDDHNTLTRETVDLLKTGARHVVHYHKLWGVAGFLGGMALAVLLAGAAVALLVGLGATAKAISAAAILGVLALTALVVAGLSFARCFEPTGAYLQKLWNEWRG